MTIIAPHIACNSGKNARSTKMGSMNSFGLQLFSFVGALCILIAYVGHQTNWMRSTSAWYNILNAVGSGILAYIAFHPFSVGFVILETVWAAVSLWALFRPRTKEAVTL